MEILFAFTYSLCLCSKSPYERAVLILMFVFIWHVYVFSTNLHTHLHKKSLTNPKRELSTICSQEPHLFVLNQTALSQIPAKSMREKRPTKVHKKALYTCKENCHEIPGIRQQRPIKEPFERALLICQYTCRRFIFRKYVQGPLRSAYVKRKSSKEPVLYVNRPVANSRENTRWFCGRL